MKASSIMSLLGSKRRAAALLAWVYFLGTSAQFSHPQVIDLDADRVPMTELNGLWRFQLGDDPEGTRGWASPQFDDSHWSLIRSDLAWSFQGYKEYTGFAWYRVRVILPPQSDSLALLIPHISTSYQIYASGHLIGHFGGMPPRPLIRNQPPQMFSIPREISVGGQPLVIAVRVWYSQPLGADDGGGLSEAPRIGKSSVVAAWRDYQWKTLFWSSAATGLHLPFELFAAAACLALFLLRRADREYLWFAAYQIFGACHDSNDLYRSFNSYPVAIHGLIGAATAFLWYVALLGLILSLLRWRRGAVFWAATAAAFVLDFLISDPLDLGWIAAPAQATVTLALSFPIYAAIVILLFRGAKQGNRDVQFLLFPFSFNFAAWLAGLTLQVLNLYGSPAVGPFANWFFELSDRPFPFGVPDIAGFLCDISTLAVLIARFARSRQEETRMTAEMEAARRVQHILIPEDTPTIPGLIVECVYQPAGHVGGDFFQILPTKDEAAWFVIGDVSGKGLPAAMAASQLVGTMRALAIYMRTPAEMLSALNQHSLASSHGGFTTCLVLRIDSGGSASAANAGHLAPYLCGQEVPLRNGLPLGLSPDSLYEMSCFKINPGDQLTLITDGVIEARNAHRELFGFERAALISMHSAQEVAEAAYSFGQEDDITVLTVRLLVGQSQPEEACTRESESRLRGINIGERDRDEAL